MRLRRPDFYRDFSCIGGACGDTCCAGWEIEIDGETAEKYLSAGGKIGERLRAEMENDEEESCFRLTEERRCPFLNGDNLCEIIIALGEEWLCDICREHPRFYQWFGDYTEAGLGLCCEEVCRLLFRRKEPLRFEMLYDEEEDREDDSSGELEEDFLLEPLLKARETAFAIAQSRNCSMDQRIRALLAWAEELDVHLQAEDAEGIEALAGEGSIRWLRRQCCEKYFEEAEVRKLLEQYRVLESLDGTWGGRMEKLLKRLPELLEARRDFLAEYRERECEYEHLAVYFLYRYFMEALFDGCVLPPVRFAAASLLVIQLLDTEIWLERGDYTEADRIFTVKLYSKEIEYCPENMETLHDFLM